MCKLLAITVGVVVVELVFCFLFCIFEFWLAMGIIAYFTGTELLCAFILVTVVLVGIIYLCSEPIKED